MVGDGGHRCWKNIAVGCNRDFITRQLLKRQIGANGRKLQYLVKALIETAGLDVVEEVGGGQLEGSRSGLK